MLFGVRKTDSIRCQTSLKTLSIPQKTNVVIFLYSYKKNIQVNSSKIINCITAKNIPRNLRALLRVLLRNMLLGAVIPLFDLLEARCAYSMH